MVDSEKLRKLVIASAPDLIVPPGIDPVKILCAILHNESSYGVFNVPRFEKAYGPGGKYYNHTQYTLWGAWACCSYSSFQIMYPTARELGFTGTPGQLWNDEEAIKWAIKLINVRIIRKQGAKTVNQIADGYNSGNCNDSIIPEVYIAKFVLAYNSDEFVRT